MGIKELKRKAQGFRDSALISVGKVTHNIGVGVGKIAENTKIGRAVTTGLGHIKEGAEKLGEKIAPKNPDEDRAFHVRCMDRLGSTSKPEGSSADQVMPENQSRSAADFGNKPPVNDEDNDHTIQPR